MRFGIDIGGSFTSIGIYNPASRKIEMARLESAGGSYLLPSAVYVEGPGKVIVGQSAINAGHERPERLMRWFKRSLGDPTARKEIDGEVWTPVECSAEVLKTLKKEAELFFGVEVRDVVITYPAFFLPEQKDLTREAARMAELNVIGMIEEPQAAALAYVIEELFRKAREESKELEDISSLIPQILERLAGEGRAVLVYDLGGGTFDVALAQFWGNPAEGGNTELHVKTLCNSGNMFLGGKNWDEEILKLAEAEDQKTYGHNFKDDPQAGRMDDICEQAKIDLSRLEAITIPCTSNHGIKLTRQAVNERTAILVEETQTFMEGILARARDEFKVPKDGITLLLSGGMCKWPAVKDMLTRLMDGKTPTVPRNVNLMVTYGAAYAAWLPVVSHERAVPVPEETTHMLDDGDLFPDICYPAIALQCIDMSGRTSITRVLPSNSSIGEYFEIVLRTWEDGQIEVEFKLLSLVVGHQDDEADKSAWKEVGIFRLTGLFPKPAGQPIYVHLKYMEGAIVCGSARDEDGHKVRICTRPITQCADINHRPMGRHQR